MWLMLLSECIHASMPSLAPFGQAVSEEKIFLTLANQKKKLFLAAMSIGQMERNGETL
jgi:hypothetical protein